MRRQVEPQSAEFRCAFCGELNGTVVDPSRGVIQKSIEDCQVCCQLNELSFFNDEWNDNFIIHSRQPRASKMQ